MAHPDEIATQMHMATMATINTTAITNPVPHALRAVVDVRRAIHQTVTRRIRTVITRTTKADLPLALEITQWINWPNLQTQAP